MKKTIIASVIFAVYVFSFENSFGKGCRCYFYTGNYTPSNIFYSVMDYTYLNQVTIDIDTVYNFNAVINDDLSYAEEGNDCSFYCGAFTTFHNVMTYNDTGFYIINFTTCLSTDVTLNFHVMRATSPTSVNQISNPNILQIYPNPTNNHFTIKNISSNKTSLLQIINPIGEVVYSEKLFGHNEYVVDANLSKGIYFVKISDGESNVIRKVIFE